MKQTTFIYALTCPDTNEVRYIGKANNPKERYYDHVKNYRSKQSHKGRWISLLSKSGKSPNIIILEEVSTDCWQESERKWIKHYQGIGANLTNITEGGQGGATNKGRKFKTSQPKIVQKLLPSKNINLLAVSDIARIKNVKLCTVKSWLDKKLIPYITIGNLRLVSPDDLAQFTPNKVGRPIKETNNDH